MNFMEEKVSSESMIKYVAMHRMMLLMYQHVHWVTKGTSYYADHLLFERLYNKIAGEIDTVAEKAIGLSSEKSVCPITMTKLSLDLMQNIFPKFDVMGEPHDLVEQMLNMEIVFLEQNEKFYDKLEEEDSLTLGLDDLLTSIHSSHEENVYLLKQRWKLCSLSEREDDYKGDQDEERPKD
jgi:DNA-binding ferritin-like protein